MRQNQKPIQVGEWLEACERLNQYSKPTHLVLAGHKLPFLGLPHRMQQLIENHHHALDRLVEYIAEPKCADRLFSCPVQAQNWGKGNTGWPWLNLLRT